MNYNYIRIIYINVYNYIFIKKLILNKNILNKNILNTIIIIYIYISNKN